MKKIFTLMLLALLVGLSSTSCLSDKENREEILLNYSGELCFNRVYDRETGTTLINLNPSYQFVYDMLAGKLNVTMSGIQLAEGYSGLSFKLTELSFKSPSEQSPYMITEATDVVPVNAGQSYVFSKFSLHALPGRYIDGAQCPVYTFSFVINNRYEVTVFPTNPVLVGTTRATRTDDGSDSEYLRKNNIVSVQVDPAKMTAKVTALKTEFNQGMPETSLVFKDLPVQVTSRGYTIETPEGDEFKVYNTNNAVMNSCTYTDFKLEYGIATGATSLSYSVDLTSKTDSYVKFGAFDVTSNLGYLFKVERED